jgi:DNA-directed RNA polymerase sigma subunit (sigma70/sigma32)
VDLQTSFDQYTAEPTPDNLHGVVQNLRPTIDYALSNLPDGRENPVLRARAHVLAAKAITRYDPKAGAALPTWVSNQLLPLRRMSRQSRSVTKVPERIQLDAFTLKRAEHEFVDKFDREPDVNELADFSRIPQKRIETIRRTLKKTPSEAALGDAGQVNETDFSGEAIDYVHQDSDHTDRRILEHKTGYGGADILPTQEVGRVLGLTPTQLSRRSTRLTYKIQQVERMLQGVQ